MRRRIVFVLPRLDGGGAERVTLHLLSGLDRQSFEPMLVLFQAEGALTGLLPENIPVITLGKKRLRQALPALLVALHQLRPEIVFSTLGYINIALLALRGMLPRHTRFVVREANTPSSSLPASPWPRTFSAAYRWLYPKADSVICQSRQMYEEMARDFCVPEDRLHLIYNPINEDGLREYLVPRREPGEGIRLVAVGRLTRQKGYDRLLAMLARVREDIRLTVFGDGPEKASLEALAAELQLGGRLRLAGFQVEPWSVVAGSDAFILPSRWEGMPNAALEALACGVPVIATPEAGGIVDVAALSSGNSVTIVREGDDFMAAMEAVVPQSPVGQLRPSLLPEVFRSSNAIERFEGVLAIGHYS